MNNLTYALALLVTLCLGPASTPQLVAATETASLPLPALQAQDEEPNITVLRSKSLPSNAVASRFSISDRAVRSLSEKLAKESFRPQKGQRDYFGHEVVYRNAQRKTVTATVALQNYSKQGSKDQAAIGKVTVSSDNQSETYSFYLVAPEGNFQDAIEYRVDRGFNVVRANSWWSCFWSRVRSKCGSVGSEALTSCSGTWYGFITCIFLKVGACATKALACCACDCGWWCKLWVGCCDR